MLITPWGPEKKWHWVAKQNRFAKLILLPIRKQRIFSFGKASTVTDDLTTAFKLIRSSSGIVFLLQIKTLWLNISLMRIMFYWKEASKPTLHTISQSVSELFGIWRLHNPGTIAVLLQVVLQQRFSFLVQFRSSLKKKKKRKKIVKHVKNDGYRDVCFLPPAHNMHKHKPCRVSITDSINILFLHAWAFIEMEELC